MALETKLMKKMPAQQLVVIIREGTRDMDGGLNDEATREVVRGAWAQLQKTAPAVHASLKARVAAGLPLYQ